MRLVKTIGLTALAVAAVLAFAAPSAMAEGSTALCKTNEDPCAKENQIGGVELSNYLPEVKKQPVPFDLKNEIANVLCLDDSMEISALGLANPQLVHVVSASLTGCGTNSNHNNCAYTTEELALLEVLKIGPDRGMVKYLNGKIRTKCTIFGFIKIDCVYDQTGLEYEIEGGEEAAYMSAEGAPATLAGGSGLCPEEAEVGFSIGSVGELHISS